MTPFVVVVIIVLLVSVVLGVYVVDRQADRHERVKPSNEFAFPLTDDLPIREAEEQALKILERFGRRSCEPIEQRWAIALHKDTALVLEAFSHMTFDSLTCQLDFHGPDADDRNDHTPVGYVRIGTWPAGEQVFAPLDTADPRIYVEVGENEYEVLAPTIFHYIVKAKQESDWADQLLSSHDCRR